VLVAFLVGRFLVGPLLDELDELAGGLVVFFVTISPSVKR